MIPPCPPLFACSLALAAAGSLLGDTVPLAGAINPAEANYEFSRPTTDRDRKAPLRIAGRIYATGVSTELETTLALAVNGATRFTAQAGVDDATATDDPVLFVIEADGEELWRSPARHRGQPAMQIDLALAGKKEVRLRTLEAGHALSQAQADWADAQFEVVGETPRSVPASPVREEPYRLTPPPGAAPRLNNARIFGVHPGNPFLLTIAATGDRPMRFAAEGLPAGLTVDPVTGRITGTVGAAGAYDVTLRATNAEGTATQPLRIEAGEQLALTPALGWNSWNCWADAVDQDKILRSARAMAASGLVNHGWSYINIDDTWQGARDPATHALQPNEKFPDLPGLAAAVHALGLKLGIYSTPWITSYATYAGGSADNPAGLWTRPAGPKQPNRKIKPWAIGRYSFAAADARQWAAWGVDYLKYDWNPNEVPETREMADALRASGRDIIYSLSNAAPFASAGDLARLANSWRTTGDIRDSWGSLQRIGFSQGKWRAFGGPGHWNDPDMLVVGYVGWGPKLHLTNLTPSEQYTHLTLWCLLSAPLLIGCDLERLDEFTLNLLGNDEVIAIDQDVRGEPAAPVLQEGRRQVWVKNLADGSRAIGLFNLSREHDAIAFAWEQLGMKKPARLRDLWRQKDLEIGADGVSLNLPRHGTALLQVWPAP